MIRLNTGLPGAGKTLNSISELMKKAEAENRPVYFNGITDCKVPGWVHLDNPEEWWKLPPNSYILIDEAQRVFRPRAYSSQVPQHVAELETHRHKGLDLWLITQHPKLLDTSVRRLVEQHVHYVRAFGSHAATRHEWGECQDDPQQRSESIRTLVPYPKEVFALYKSAEVHTHKRRIPARLLMLVAIPVVLAGLVYGVTQTLGPKKKPAEVTAADAKKGSAPEGSSPKPAATTLSPADYVARYVPRVPGLPHTAAAYDEVTKPKTAPRPAACMQMGDRCECFTQQATRIAMEPSMCAQVVARGYFQDWHDQESPNGQMRNDARPVAASSFHPPKPVAEPEPVPSSPVYIKATGYERPPSTSPLQAQ
jgi:hypothetical protein